MPGKNIRSFAGKPLIVHSIEQARASGLFAAIAVSSDSAAILEVARAAGADVLVERPAEMATDTAAKMPAIRHCVQRAEQVLSSRFETTVDLAATSPLRLPEDIVGAVALFEATGVCSVITGTPARHSPYFALVEQRPDGSVGLAKQPPGELVRRQDAPACFDMDGSIYVWRRDVLLADPKVFYPDTRLFVIPVERSQDIDTPLDFEIAEFLMNRRLAGHSGS